MDHHLRLWNDHFVTIIIRYTYFYEIVLFQRSFNNEEILVWQKVETENWDKK